MTWKVVPVAPEKVTTQYLYGLSKRHRLVPDDLDDALEYYGQAADDCVAMRVVNGGDTTIADILVMGRGSAEAELIFIPCAKYFAPGEGFEEPIDEAMRPVLDKLIDLRGLRRISSYVPKTRSRTFQALRACGFNKEGVQRQKLKFRNKPAEDMVCMGYLPGKEKS